MRSSLHLAIVLHFHQPPTASAVALEDCFDDVYEPVLDALDADERLLLNLHFGGRILEHALAHRPDFLSRLARLWRQGRVEVLGGAFYDPVLAAIPERDAIGQLQLTANWLKRQLGKVPQGAWLALRAWDPGLPRALGAAGVAWTLLDDAQFLAAGLEPEDVHGHYTTERAGHPVGMFPIDAALSRILAEGPASRMRDQLVLSNMAHQPDERLEAVALRGETLVADGRFAELLSVLDSEHHWLKTTPLSRAFELFPTRGRVYLGSGADPALTEWSRPAASRANRRRLQQQLESVGMWRGVEHFVGRVLFDNFLVKYGEANRLHKRMLAASAAVDRLRAVLAERQRKGKASASDGKARKVLERACDALWRAQTHAVYWHGGPNEVGIYDPRMRLSTTRQLMVAQRMVERALGDPARGGWSAFKLDHDADGNAEAVVLTPTLAAVVHAAQGGTLWELDLRDRGIPMLTSMSPVEEPYDDTLVGNEVVLVDAEDHPSLPVDEPDWARTTNPKLARRRVDRIARGAFQDHFLGAETTLETFGFRQFRQLGDFAVEPWELMKVAAPDGDVPAGRVLVGRTGVVKDVDRTLLLRLEKEYRFDPEKPRLTVTHTISNRSRETASAWHGLEWTLGIPSGDAANVVATTFGGDQERIVPLDAGGPQDLGWLSWIELKDTEAEVSVVIQLPDLLRAWWVPVTSVHEGPDGWQELVQGQTLLLHRELEIWGEDSQSLEVVIDFLR